MSEHVLHLIGGEDNETATVVTEFRNDLCHLTFRYRGREIEASANEYFEAFCRVREHLEAEGLIPFCYGASLDVFPSGMCRDMGSGLCAYRLTGSKPGRNSQVGIFEEGEDVIPATVAKQRQFFEDFIRASRVQ